MAVRPELRPGSRLSILYTGDFTAKIAREKLEGEPVVDYDEDYQTLHISDPFFAFYLRWARRSLSPSLMYPLLPSDGSTDLFARWIAAAGLAVAILSITLNLLIWQRSRPRLKVRLRAAADPDPWRTGLVIEVVSVGRLAVVVKSLGLRDHIVVKEAVGRTRRRLSSPCPSNLPRSNRLSRSPRPNTSNHEVPMEAIVRRWDANKKLAFVG